MIINLWSTPRTGSVWYSKYLSSINPNSILVTELFNKYHMNIYHNDIAGGRLNLREYQDGAYYEEYLIIDGKLQKQKIYSQRTRNIQDETLYRESLLNEANDNTTYVLHNHVMPMDDDIKQRLVQTGRNFYIYRRDRRAQLGSYAIAQATKKFAKFDTSPEETNIITETNMPMMKEMIDRIRVWDKMPKDSAIAYEDIDFSKAGDGMWPQKQNKDYKLRLSSDILKYIDELVTQYEEE